jgi:D-alanine-D-alanine ligase-like ATP-grasp enzyme
LQVPFWDDVLKAACDAHDLTPDLGICGFDVAITDQGPVILECNDKPNHMLYQYPARKGVRQPDLAPIWKSLVSRKRAAA